MRSLRELTSEDVRGLRGICFDVDDTVTDRGILDPDAYASLFRLRAHGLTLIAATGRPLGFAEVIARTWPVDAAVGENGAGFLARVGRGLRVEYADSATQRAEQALKLARIRDRVTRDLPHVAVSSDSWARRCDLAFDVGEEHALTPAQVDELLALMREEGALVTVSSIHAHAQYGLHDKATGIAQAALSVAGLTRPREELAFIGDSGNDAAAFAYFALTFGVANVVQHLTRLSVAPRFVAERERGAGFSEIASRILALRAGAR